LTGSEIGQLFRWTTVNRQAPDVRYTLARDNVRERATTGQPTNNLKSGIISVADSDLARDIKQFSGPSAYKGNDGYPPLRVLLFPVTTSDLLSVRRDYR